ncbi:MAG: hypothetical protein ABSH49_34070 [Bryobacteraceae bacterium]|jgi:hypothetical protein
MKNVAMLTLGGAFCAMLLAVSAAAADKSAALSVKPAPSHSTPMRSGWPPETLSRKISMVDGAEKLVVVEDAPDGTHEYRVLLLARWRRSDCWQPSWLTPSPVQVCT